MIRLLQLELQKLILNRTSKILIFISFILPLCVIVLSAIKINFFGFFTLELGELGIFNFPIVWHITTYFSALFKFFFAIVVVSMIGNEYSNKTLKQNLIQYLDIHKSDFMRLLSAPPEHLHQILMTMKQIQVARIKASADS